MELDSLLSSPRWRILEILASDPSSPMEISALMETSVAYISQQLKLLEAAGIVKKEKTGKAEKGKPRNLYSISNEFLHITLLVKGSPKRKSIKINEHQKIVINIWMLPDEKVHHIIEKFVWELDSEINDIKGIYLDDSRVKSVLHVISDSKKVNSKSASFDKLYGSLLDVKVDGEERDFSGMYPIYDPLFLSKGTKLKGGDR
jgi:predicted transcriptional regulator